MNKQIVILVIGLCALAAACARPGEHRSLAAEELFGQRKQIAQGTRLTVSGEVTGKANVIAGGIRAAVFLDGRVVCVLADDTLPASNLAKAKVRATGRYFFQEQDEISGGVFLDDCRLDQSK